MRGLTLALVLLAYSARADDGARVLTFVGEENHWMRVPDQTLVTFEPRSEAMSYDLRVSPGCWLDFDHDEEPRDGEVQKSHVYRIKCEASR